MRNFANSVKKINKRRCDMKKLTYLLVVLGLAAFSIGGTKSAFAQSWGGVYGSGNIAPKVTQENPDGVFRYPFSTNESGVSAFAKAPAAKAKAKSKAVVQPWELR
jgi:hypothetical protein